MKMAINQYVSMDDVEHFLGKNWQGNEDALHLVMLANLWLSDRGVIFSEVVQDEIKQAGVELVKLALNNKLFVDTQTGLLSETVQADSVSVSQSFGVNAKMITKEIQIVEALIKPYLKVKKGNRFIPVVRM